MRRLVQRVSDLDVHEEGIMLIAARRGTDLDQKATECGVTHPYVGSQRFLPSMLPVIALPRLGMEHQNDQVSHPAQQDPKS